MLTVFSAQDIDMANRLLRIARNRRKQRRHVPQPALDGVRIQNIAIVVAFDEEILPGVHDIRVEIECDETLWRLDPIERKITEIKRRTNPVDVEYDGDQGRPADIALDRQLRQETAKRDVWM